MTEPADDFTRWGAAELARAIREREVSATEVVGAHLARISEADSDINAVIHVAADAALAEASRLDRASTRKRRNHQGQTRGGALAGVPFLVKDNIDVGGQVTSAGSAGRPVEQRQRDAATVTRMRAAGAILLGRANMDELAMGASTQTSAFGPTRNPLDVRRSPGGSSGGSAAAVAAFFSPLSLGTDTGGSIREPAAQCGVVGMAPSHGLVPMSGVLPFAPDFDTLGPLARSVKEVGLALSVLAGRGLRSATSHSDNRTHIRIAVPDELITATNHPGVLKRTHDALDRLRSDGYLVESTSLPSAPDALSAYMVITSVEAISVLEPIVRHGLAGGEVVRRLELAHSLRGTAEHRHALDVRRRLRLELATILTDHDLIVCPTMPTTAPVLFDPGPTLAPNDLTDPMISPYTDCWTVVTSLAGFPSVSVPVGLSPDDGMPVGLMIAGRHREDALVLAVAEEVEAAAHDLDTIASCPPPPTR